MGGDGNQGGSAQDSIVEQRRESILNEISNLNLQEDIKKVAEAISHVNFSSRNQDFIIEVCCKLHEIYENFSQPLIQNIIKAYREP